MCCGFAYPKSHRRHIRYEQRNGHLLDNSRRGYHSLHSSVAYPLNSAIRLAKHAAGVDQARVIVYHRPRQYRATYYAQAEGAESRGPTAWSQFAALLGGAGPRFLYLWWP